MQYANILDTLKLGCENFLPFNNKDNFIIKSYLVKSLLKYITMQYKVSIFNKNFLAVCKKNIYCENKVASFINKYSLENCSESTGK